VITGAGDSFSSGNDLGNFLTALSSNQFKSKEEMAEFGSQLLDGIVKVFIDFPKPLIAAVNGVAIGIMFTTLPLFDLVYATPTATFLAPFSRLGQAPEGCSTFTFPQLMGTARATEVLLLGKKINAEQAKTLGLVNEIIPQDFMTEVQDRVKKLVMLPQGSIMESKALMRRWNKEKLHMVNVEECKMLARRWQSDECMEAVLNFFQRKAKL
jgi:peroxisomal 3,2-trans-enoyl-CoA isomerase